MNSLAIEGGCGCGAVRYLIRCAPGVVLNCHCSDCRRAVGAPFVTWAIFPRDALTWVAAQPKHSNFGHRHRYFCSECGTLLAGLADEHDDIVAVSVGTMDRAEKMEPGCEAWTQDKLPWVHLAGDLPQYTAGIAADPVAR